MSSNIGILGLGVMGKNLAWNIEDKKYGSVAK
ncbi:NAD(P)-binding domain-containing protein, partial [Staphylococcus aureus]|nr:NAD(P)-binding domain-containing protein [Staphylococcus aureus]